MDRVEHEQVRKRTRICDVIDSDHLDVFSLSRAKYDATDTAKSVDSNSNRHLALPSLDLVFVLYFVVTLQTALARFLASAGLLGSTDCVCFSRRLRHPRPVSRRRASVAKLGAEVAATRCVGRRCGYGKGPSRGGSMQ